MKASKKKRWAVSFIVAAFVATDAFIVINQFIVMPWENADLPKVADPKLVIKKKARTLELFDGPTLVKTYTVVLGSTPDGDKETEGDGRTPEGEFYVFTKNAESKFYLSLGLSYPGIEDALRGLNEGLISKDEHDAIVQAVKEKKMPPQNTRLGGEIYIHGGGTVTDWTQGCVALRNEEIKELFDAIPVGAIVRILP